MDSVELTAMVKTLIINYNYYLIMFFCRATENMFFISLTADDDLI